jgi:RNA polymerase sigma-70 factor, ECF subfamily
MQSERFSCVAKAWLSHEGELRGYLRHRLADTHAAEDVLQDVFLKAMRQGQRFCALDNPKAWLFHVARNVLVDRARAARPHELLSDELVAPEPERAAPVDELAACISTCMEALSAEDAQILRSCDLEGETTRSFALARDLSVAAAKSRLLRARQRLRNQLTLACQVRFDADGSVGSHLRSTG